MLKPKKNIYVQIEVTLKTKQLFYLFFFVLAKSFVINNIYFLNNKLKQVVFLDSFDFLNKHQYVHICFACNIQRYDFYSTTNIHLISK